MASLLFCGTCFLLDSKVSSSIRNRCLRARDIPSQNRKWRPRGSTYSPQNISAAIRQYYVSLPGRDVSLQILAPMHAPPVSVSSSGYPPVVFIHGSLHAAWCWEPFLEYLSNCGISRAYAVSLRGYTSHPPAAPGTKVRVDEHVDDLTAFLDVLSGPAPIIVGHSIGGYIVQRLVSKLKGTGIAGMILLASTPPSGNSALIRRTIFRLGVWQSWKITMGFIRNTMSKDVGVCRDMFFTSTDKYFDERIEGDDVLKKYAQKFEMSVSSKLDTRDVIPIIEGVPALAGKVLVMGGEDDVLIDKHALEEAAAFWGGGLVVLSDTPHDLMLATTRDYVAYKIINWLKSVV